jgi:hypothetical protein
MQECVPAEVSVSEPKRCPVVDFDDNSPQHTADPVASYRRLRDDAPIAWTEAHGGY